MCVAWGVWRPKRLDDLLPGEYYLSFDFLHIDSWDGEEGYLLYNDKMIWSRAHYSGNATRNICGRGGAFNDDGVYLDRVVVKVTHLGGNAIFKWGSTLMNPQKLKVGA